MLCSPAAPVDAHRPPRVTICICHYQSIRTECCSIDGRTESEKNVDFKFDFTSLGRSMQIDVKRIFVTVANTVRQPAGEERFGCVSVALN